MSLTTSLTSSRAAGHRTRRTLRAAFAGTLGVALTLGLAACGDDDDNAAGTSHETVSVTDQYGTTDIPENPERVVVANPAWRDALVALDVPFTLSVHWSVYADAPWEGTTDAEEVLYTAPADYPVEKIASTDPDVILGAPVGQPELHDRLADIAPTIGTIGKSVDDWRQILTLAGQIFHKEDKASELEQAFDDKVSTFRDANPGLKDKTFTFTAFIQDQVYAVANPEDALNVFFTDLGMKINPAILDMQGEGGRVKISLENLDLLDSDAIIHQGDDSILTDVSGWSDLPAVKDNTTIYLDPNPLNQPSILSVDWALDHTESELSKVAEL